MCIIFIDLIYWLKHSPKRQKFYTLQPAGIQTTSSYLPGQLPNNPGSTSAEKRTVKRSEWALSLVVGQREGEKHFWCLFTTYCILEGNEDLCFVNVTNTHGYLSQACTLQKGLGEQIYSCACRSAPAPHMQVMPAQVQRSERQELKLGIDCLLLLLKIQIHVGYLQAALHSSHRIFGLSSTFHTEDWRIYIWLVIPKLWHPRNTTSNFQPLTAIHIWLLARTMPHFLGLCESLRTTAVKSLDDLKVLLLRQLAWILGKSTHKIIPLLPQKLFLLNFF